MQWYMQFGSFSDRVKVLLKVFNAFFLSLSWWEKENQCVTYAKSEVEAVKFDVKWLTVSHSSQIKWKWKANFGISVVKKFTYLSTQAFKQSSRISNSCSNEPIDVIYNIANDCLGAGIFQSV